MSSKVVVTGGAGFIGSHIVDLFVEHGHQVAVVDNLSSGRRENVPAGVPLRQLDIRADSLREYLQREEPDILVHAAAQISVRHSLENPLFDTQTNVAGLVNILQAFHGRPLPFIVFLSSGGAIYGEQSCYPADESHPAKPLSIYGLAKRVGEMYLELWRHLYGLKFAALRLANVYGPRQNSAGEAGVVAIFNDRLLRGLTPTINGTGEQTRDFVYVADVARAVYLAAHGKVTGTFNIGSGRETAINELYRLIAEALGKDMAPAYGSAKPGEQLRSSIDASSAGHCFGWKPEVSLEEGVPRTSRWFEDEFSDSQKAACSKPLNAPFAAQMAEVSEMIRKLD